LIAGKGDIIATNLTWTAQREQQVEFVTPIADAVSEVVVTGPNSPEIKTLDDLAGQSVFVNPESSYADSLEKLNADFVSRHLEPIKILKAPTDFETEDALEMVQAGLVGITISDTYLAEFWDDIFKDLRVHEHLKVRTGGKAGYAI
jgi:ABC-type amino acid transport substrate-binding protein